MPLGRFRLDRSRGELLTLEGRHAPLRRQAVLVLLALAERAGHVVGKDELIEIVWPGKFVTDDSLVQAVADIRRLLGVDGEGLLRTVPRRGYMLEAAARRADALPNNPPLEHTSLLGRDIELKTIGDRLRQTAARSGDHEDDPPHPRVESSPSELLGPKPAVRQIWWKRSRVWAAALVAAGVVIGASVFVAHSFTASIVNIDQEIMNRRATAVLAFVDKSGAKTGSTLGDDLADVIAGRLVHAGVRVIGRAATVRQDPSAPDFVRIGQEQGVRFVVAGRIRREGGGIQVDAYLTEIASGAVLRLHEDQFNSDEEAMRSDYGNAIARALSARYDELETARARLPGHERDPVDVLALAWHDLDRGNTTEELETARSRFEFAVNADPNSVESSYGLGLAQLSQFYCLCDASPREKLDVAEKALKRTLDLVPDNPQGLAAWADILLLRQRPDEALRVWRKALEISPDNQNAHVRMAGALVKQGQLADAQAHLSRVTDLQPHQLLRQQWLLQTLADASFSQGHDDDAYKVLRDWTAEFPNNGKPYLMMAAIDALHGRDAAAAANLARHRQMLPLSTISYVVLTYPSTDPGFLSQRERLVSGLRKAGLPEGTK